MSTFSKLADIQSRQESFDKKQEERNRPKANWFSIKSNESLIVRFLQELDEDAENYDKDRGVFLGAVEHQAPGPKGFMSRALDTYEEEGKDFAREMDEERPGEGWKSRENFYINVAVKRPGGVQAEILSRNLNSQFVKDLVREYTRSKGKGITGKTFEIQRTGTGPQTQWRLYDAEEDLDVTGVEPWNLNEYAVRHIPYDEQKEYYMRNYEAPNSSNDNDGFKSEPSSEGESVSSAGASSGKPAFKW